jgi:DHA2 family multidrug resistance protein
MMRQLGGAFGVALISTFVSRQTQVHRYALVTHLNVNDLNVQQQVAQMAVGMMQRPGMDSVTARQTAYAMLDGAVDKQATLLSYMDVFLYVGIIFLVCVPLVLLFIKNAKTKISMADAAH